MQNECEFSHTHIHTYSNGVTRIFVYGHLKLSRCKCNLYWLEHNLVFSLYSFWKQTTRNTFSYCTKNKLPSIGTIYLLYQINSQIDSFHQQEKRQIFQWKIDLSKSLRGGNDWISVPETVCSRFFCSETFQSHSRHIKIMRSIKMIWISKKTESTIS